MAMVLSEYPIQQMSSAKGVSQLGGKADFSPNLHHTDRGVIEGVGGSGRCGSLVLVFPSSSVTKAKGRTSDGACESLGEKIREVTMSPFPKSSFSAIPLPPVLALNSLHSFAKTLPISVQMSRSPSNLPVLPKVNSKKMAVHCVSIVLAILIWMLWSPF